MLSIDRQFKTSTFNNSDWYFLPPMLSGSTGIIIGLVIAYMWGWI